MNAPVTKVALTGATGFIGSWLQRCLVRQGCEVRALTRTPRAAVPDVAWVTGRLDDAPALQTLVSGCDIVIHCAGAVRGRTLADFEVVNLAGAENLANAVGAAAPTARVLLISSLAAREPGLSHYAASKHRGEQRLRAILGERLTILRPPAVYGPGDTELSPLLKAMAGGLAPVPRHSGRFALLYVEDLAAAVLAWLAHPQADGGVFELHDAHPAGGYSWADVRLTMETRRGGRIRLVRVPRGAMNALAAINLALSGLTRRSPMLSPGKVRELFHPDWRCSNDALELVTGWQPRVALAEGLERILAAV